MATVAVSPARVHAASTRNTVPSSTLEQDVPSPSDVRAAVTAPSVTLARREHVAVITMSHPARRNALGPAILAGLTQALHDAADARAVVLRAGDGDAVWCAGFDIGELEPGRDPLAADGLLSALFRAVAEHPAPVIAMGRGSAWGGGADLLLRCDMAVADPAFTLAFTPARLGLPYDADGLLNVLLRAGPAVAMELFATGSPMAADRAHALGLLNHVVPAAGLEAFTLGLAARVAANAPLSVRSAKQHIRALVAALPLPPATWATLAAGRRRALDSEDYATGLDAFHARVTPEFRGR